MINPEWYDVGVAMIMAPLLVSIHFMCGKIGQLMIDELVAYNESLENWRDIEPNHDIIWIAGAYVIILAFGVYLKLRWDQVKFKLFKRKYSKYWDSNPQNNWDK